MRALLRAGFFGFALAGAAPLAASPALAQAAAPPVDQTSAETFIQSLADQTFSVIRTSGTESTRNDRFRNMVRQHFAIRTIGDRLIRQYRAKITPEQYNAYVAALPDFIVSTYADRLAAYGDATFKVVRSMPKGDRGDADVFSRVSRPGQARPFDAVWSLTKDTAGRYRIANLTVEGVNLALSQEADFSAKIQRDGFDALVEFMRSRGKNA